MMLTKDEKEFIGAVMCGYEDLLSRRKVKATIDGRTDIQAINEERSKIFQMLIKLSN